MTANVVATLAGTENPDLIYVVSSHFDSALVSPGADDDSSGTAALLETINHQLVTEVAKTTAASIMLLASSPSRITGLRVTSYGNGTATLAWTPSPERSVTGYLVTSRQPSSADSKPLRVLVPSARLAGIPAGTEVSVKAVNAKGMEGWDWARVVVR